MHAVNEGLVNCYYEPSICIDPLPRGYLRIHCIQCCRLPISCMLNSHGIIVYAFPSSCNSVQINRHSETVWWYWPSFGTNGSSILGYQGNGLRALITGVKRLVGIWHILLGPSREVSFSLVAVVVSEFSRDTCRAAFAAPAPQVTRVFVQFLSTSSNFNHNRIWLQGEPSV